MNCPFAAPGRQEACLSLQKQRDALMTREYDRNECYACPMRRKRLEGAQEPERIAIPPAQFNKTETIIPKKEDAVDQEKVKENILRVLGRKGTMTSSSLKLFAGNKESRENFLAAVDALAGEGKVVTKEGARPGSLSVSLPGAPPNDATIPSKPPRRVNRKSTTPPIKTRAKKDCPVPSSREPVANNRKKAVELDEPNPISMAIVESELRRTLIDVAIEVLRALA